MVPFSNKVVTGFVLVTDTGVIRRTPLSEVPERVRRMVPGWPAAPFNTNCVTPCCPAWILGRAVINFVVVPVTDVTTFVVMMVIGDLTPAVTVDTPALGCPRMLVTGMVLMIVVIPGLETAAMLLTFMMVGFIPIFPACVVLIIAVGLPSGLLTSFRIVPAGNPLVKVVLPGTGALINLMVLVTPPSTAVLTGTCCCTTGIVVDFCIGRTGIYVVVAGLHDEASWAAADFNIEVAGALTIIGGATTFTVAGTLFVPGVTEMVFIMVASDGSPTTEEVTVLEDTFDVATVAPRGLIPLI